MTRVAQWANKWSDGGICCWEHVKLARLAALDVTHVGIGITVGLLAYFTRWRIFCRLETVLHGIALARQYLFQMSITLRFYTLARLAIACWSRHVRP
jgi:hypothetical protein